MEGDSSSRRSDRQCQTKPAITMNKSPCRNTTYLMEAALLWWFSRAMQVLATCSGRPMSHTSRRQHTARFGSG